MSSDSPEDMRKAGAIAEKEHAAEKAASKTSDGKAAAATSAQGSATNLPGAGTPSSAAIAPSGSGVPATSVPAKDALVTKVPPKFTDADVIEAARLPDFKNTMKGLFPESLDVREAPLLPLEYGGSTFTGLVARLLGETASREFEGLRTRRFIYYANGKNNVPVGLGHGSSVDGHGKNIDVFVFYTAGGTIKQLQVTGVPAGIMKQLVDGGYLSQFNGRSLSEFEVIRGKKGRIKSKGIFLRTAREPKSDARFYFDKIMRAVRYNTAFMGVAYFITQHPDMADKNAHEFPEEVEITKGQATSGPEAFIRSKKISGSAVDGKITMQHGDDDADDSDSDDDQSDGE